MLHFIYNIILYSYIVIFIYSYIYVSTFQQTRYCLCHYLWRVFSTQRTVQNGSQPFIWHVWERFRTVLGSRKSENGSERFLNYLVPTVQAGKNGSERFLRWLVWCFASRTVCSCEISFVILLMKAKGWTEFSRPTKSVWILCWSCIFTQANYSTSHRRLLVIFAT